MSLIQQEGGLRTDLKKNHLRSILNYGLLQLRLLHGVQIDCYTDVVALTVEHATLDGNAQLFSRSYRLIKDWFAGVGLSIAVEKTEVLLATGRRRRECCVARIGGSRPLQRRLYASVVDSVPLYGNPVWAESLRVGAYRRRMEAVQCRVALHVFSA